MSPVLSLPRRFGLGLAALFVASALFACDSDEGEPGPSGTNGPSTSQGVKKKAGETGCQADDECETGVCFVDARSFCTVRCTQDDAATVCVAPYTRCNNKGYCRN